MIKWIALLGLILVGTVQVVVAEVLIVADEFPAMAVVAAKLQSEESIESKQVWQTNLPPRLERFQAIIVYIHRDLSPEAEEALIDYTKAGGKLVVLHHSISSGKRKNQNWFRFLGVSLPDGAVSQGGYKWIDGASWELVNLDTNHFIMTNRVSYPRQILYVSTNAPGRSGTLPAFSLEQSEVYLNHVHSEPRTVLMGFRYVDPTTGTIYMQDRAGWVKPAGKGWIVYLMPGHTTHDFENPAYGRIVANAVIFRP